MRDCHLQRRRQPVIVQEEIRREDQCNSSGAILSGLRVVFHEVGTVLGRDVEEPAFCATFLPEFSSVPLADLVMLAIAVS